MAPGPAASRKQAMTVESLLPGRGAEGAEPSAPSPADTYQTLRTFDSLGVAEPLAKALADQGITTAFPIQALTIADALAGRDVCGKAKTGSGKTLAFGLPLLQRTAAPPGDLQATSSPTSGDGGGRSPQRRSGQARPRALVLLPTRELAVQVHEVLESLGKAIGLKVVAVYGGADIDRQIATLRKGVDVVIATPGRLIDLGDRGELSVADVAILVLDEADRMADMGFMPQVEWVLRRLEQPHQTLLFSATLDGAVDRLVSRYLTDPVHHEVASSTQTVAAMEHRFLQVHQMDKVKVCAAICRPQDKVLVFVRTKRGADRLVEQLEKEGIRSAAIHGDLRQANRERALADFSSGKLHVLVATDVAARGLHIEGVDAVIHYDPPEDHKAYLHRSGRTARAGSTGVVATLVLWNQVVEAEVIQRRLGLRLPIVEVFSNDPRLADLTSWVPSADEGVL
jgi:superfamily II DNA/RNA helicase